MVGKVKGIVWGNDVDSVSVGVESANVKSPRTIAVPVLASSIVKVTVDPGAMVAELLNVTPPSEDVVTTTLPL